MAAAAREERSEVLEVPAACFTHGCREVELLLQTLRDKLQLANTAQHLVVDTCTDSCHSSTPFLHCGQQTAAIKQPSADALLQEPGSSLEPCLLLAQPSNLHPPAVHIKALCARATHSNRVALQLRLGVEAHSQVGSNADATVGAGERSMRTHWRCGYAAVLVLKVDGSHCVSESRWEQQDGLITIEAQVPMSVMGSGGSVDDQVSWAAVWLQLHDPNSPSDGCCTLLLPLRSDPSTPRIKPPGTLPAMENVPRARSCDHLVEGVIRHAAEEEIHVLRPADKKKVLHGRVQDDGSGMNKTLLSGDCGDGHSWVDSGVQVELVASKVSGTVGVGLNGLVSWLEASGEFMKVPSATGTTKLAWVPAHSGAPAPATVQLVACCADTAELVLQAQCTETLAALQRSLERILRCNSQGAEYVVQPNKMSSEWLDTQQNKLAAVSGMLDSHLACFTAWLEDGEGRGLDEDTPMKDADQGAGGEERVTCSLPASEMRERLRAYCHMLDVLS